MPVSGRLVTHMCRFRIWRLTRSTTRSSTCSRGDRTPEVSGHSSRASKIMYIGCWGEAETRSMFVRQFIKSLSLVFACHPYVLNKHGKVGRSRDSSAQQTERVKKAGDCGDASYRHLGNRSRNMPQKFFRQGIVIGYAG